jgi:hypothetical protein
MIYGSIYGEDIYSADLYSWETGWEGTACDPISRQVAQTTPPIVVWPGVVCAPIAREPSYQRPPVVVWQPLACQPLTVR